MSIGNTQAANANAPPDFFSVPAHYGNIEPQQNQEPQNESSLSRITDVSGFSSVASRLQAALEHMEQPGSSVIDTLTANVNRLQDGFVDTLYTKLRVCGIDLSAKLTLRLGENARLVISGDHPNQEQIDSLLASSPELSAAFAEIASQSAALRDIRSLHNMILTNCHMGVPSAPGEAVYQVSIKGEMNHFYFSRLPSVWAS